MLLIVVSELLLCDLLTPLLLGLWQSRRSWWEHVKEQELLALLLLESNKRMIRLWHPNVPIKNRFPMTQFLSQEPTFLLRFPLYPVMPQTSGKPSTFGVWRDSPDVIYSKAIQFAHCLQSIPQQRSPHHKYTFCTQAV